MRPTYPGQVPVVRMNLVNIVLVVDLSQSSSMSLLTGTVSVIIMRGFPIRFGIVPLFEFEDSERMARVFYYLMGNYGYSPTIKYFNEVWFNLIRPSFFC
jgi:UDP-glucose:glycoprotein glucosyltransferase